jgi:hypothetical protein
MFIEDSQQEPDARADLAATPNADACGPGGDHNVPVGQRHYHRW